MIVRNCYCNRNICVCVTYLILICGIYLSFLVNKVFHYVFMASSSCHMQESPLMERKKRAFNARYVEICFSILFPDQFSCLEQSYCQSDLVATSPVSLVPTWPHFPTFIGCLVFPISVIAWRAPTQDPCKAHTWPICTWHGSGGDM